MGKSEGNAYVMKDILAKGYSPLSLRYFFLQSNYRSKQNFTWDNLTASETALKKLQIILSKMPDDGVINESYKTLFHEFINDDFNVTAGLGIVWELLKNPDVSDEDKKATILDFDRVLGLRLDKTPVEKVIIIPEHIQKLLDARAEARLDKDFGLSDDLRNQIHALGFKVTDVDGKQEVSKI
jgi:cysteinyl-tRNA synthetase